MAREVQPIEVLSRQSKIVHNVVNNESDIACVLILTSYLDQCVASLLNNFLINKSNTVDKLLNPNGILGTFRARSELIYSLGLIPKSLFENLITIGQIRNRFAHSHLEVDFSNKNIIDLINSLQTPNIKFYVNTHEDKPTRISLSNFFVFDSIPKNKFNIISIMMADRILRIGLSIKHKEREIDGW